MEIKKSPQSDGESLRKGAEGQDIFQCPASWSPVSGDDSPVSGDGLSEFGTGMLGDAQMSRNDKLSRNDSDYENQIYEPCAA